MNRRAFLHSTIAAGALAPTLLRAASPQPSSINPKCSRAVTTKFELAGPAKPYVTGVIDQWLKIAPHSNPAILEMFRDRDRLPLRQMEPWAGEFAGKYLTAAVQVYRISGDPQLRKAIEWFVPQVIAGQAEDGYLGPWPKQNRLTGSAPNVGSKGGPTWDAWGHYHTMLGLLLWHEQSSDRAALDSAARIADLLCNKFLTARLVDTGSTEMNLAVIHSLCLLYRRRNEPRYIALATRILDEFSAKDDKGNFLAGNYLRGPLAGQEFFQLPKPRWESLHPIMGLVELYWLTGNEDCRRAFEKIWWSIVKLDRHNNGGFSSGEQAQGNPYHPGAIETCCTIAWMALSVEMLRLTGNSIVADELELSTLNSVLGLHSPTGRWVTYNTPMDGVRKASAHDIVFQARAGSPELNCCSVNGARGLGMISDWALMRSGNGLLINWYGPSTFVTELTSTHQLTITQETKYPREPGVRLRIQSSTAAAFPISLRIPYWSQKTRVMVNGRPAPAAQPGTYLQLPPKKWVDDVIDIEFDFSFHFWKGEKEYAGKTSIYRGPILLTYDRRFNDIDPDAVPELSANGLQGKLVDSTHWISPIVLMEFAATNGTKLRLCDFASAGVTGSPYRSWLPVKDAPAHAFSERNPLGTSRGT
jgi:uncharacterized protein